MTVADITDWIGRTRTEHDVMRPAVADGLLAAIASMRAEGPAAPPLAHWLCFHEIPLRSELGADGHPRRGGFLPPVTLPRRMWAAGSVEWQRPVHIGAALTRTSTVRDVRAKSGRSGELVFVTVDHQLSDADGLVLTEQQDIVYRDAPSGPAPEGQPGMANPAWNETVTPDPVLLFRYSALTGNTHRIHYDRPYAMAEEGYPALVVHGPLIATMLLNALVTRHPGAFVSHFSFRAVRPLFDTAPFTLCGTGPDADGVATLNAVDASGALCMDARATLT